MIIKEPIRVGQTWETNEGKIVHVANEMSGKRFRVEFDANRRVHYPVSCSGWVNKGKYSEGELLRRLTRVIIVGVPTEWEGEEMNRMAESFRKVGCFVLRSDHLGLSWADDHFHRQVLAQMTTCEVISFTELAQTAFAKLYTDAAKLCGMSINYYHKG